MRVASLIVSIMVWTICGTAGVFTGHAMRNVLATPNNPQAELQLMKELYLSGGYRDLLDELDIAQQHPGYYPIREPMLYLRWLSLRALGERANSRAVMENFLADYPGDVLCANIHLVSAYDQLSASDYTAAGRELRLTIARYPKTVAAKDATAILRDLPSEQ